MTAFQKKSLAWLRTNASTFKVPFMCRPPQSPPHAHSRMCVRAGQESGALHTIPRMWAYPVCGRIGTDANRRVRVCWRMWADTDRMSMLGGHALGLGFRHRDQAQGLGTGFRHRVQAQGLGTGIRHRVQAQGLGTGIRHRVQAQGQADMNRMSRS